MYYDIVIQFLCENHLRLSPESSELAFELDDWRFEEFETVRSPDRPVLAPPKGRCKSPTLVRFPPPSRRQQGRHSIFQFIDLNV